jgi:CheY-like chemotaxis protein
MRLDPGATILVADDEELMREVVSLMLQDAGAEVLLARDGDECLELFNAHADKIGLVMVDFSMPGRDGYECCKEILKSSDTVKCIVTSGLPITSEVKVLEQQSRIRFLSKPFSEGQLIAAISEMLQVK